MDHLSLPDAKVQLPNQYKVPTRHCLDASDWPVGPVQIEKDNVL